MKLDNVLIVGCGKTKIWSRASDLGDVPAASAYCGPLFRSTVAYAAKFAGTNWRILSARYGLLYPDTLIENYDTTMGRTPPTKMVRVLARQIEESIPEGVGITCLAGEVYVEWVRQAAGARLVGAPLRGESLFARMRMLADAVRSGVPLSER